jgi:pyruvate/2-oxoacid:ferredoxin oxidoreductase alpha subunit
MDTLAELLRQGADKLVNLPSEAQRFITNPQAFTQLLTGKNPLPKETGFAAGATGLLAQEMSVLDPNQAPYMQGYSQGEPIGYAGMAAPFAAPAAVATVKALAPKAGMMAENYMVRQGMMPSIVPQGADNAITSIERMAIAQRNAALPVSEGGLGLPTNNTAAQRATALGFDTPFFHGQKPKVEKEYIEGLGYFESDPQLNLINEIKKGAGKAEEGAFFGSVDADIASKYATKKGVVYPLLVRSQDLFEAGFTKPYPLKGTQSQKDQWMKEAEQFNRGLDANKERYVTESILNAEKSNKGGTIIRNIEDNPMDYIGAPQTDVLAIQTAPVRSRFAAFDPKQVNNPNILAGGLAVPLVEEDSRRAMLEKLFNKQK